MELIPVITLALVAVLLVLVIILLARKPVQPPKTTDSGAISALGALVTQNLREGREAQDSRLAAMDDGLTVEFAKKRHASDMVRGLRAVTDFENEIQLAQTNHALMPGIETMFLATSIKWSYLSSTIVKEAARYGSDIGKFVTPNVEKAVNEKFDERRRNGKL